jgi:hypothetical protein
MSITFKQRTKTAHTTLNMTGMPPNTSAVGLVVAGACDAPGGTLWQGANFSADPNDKVVNFKVKFSGCRVLSTTDESRPLRDGELRQRADRLAGRSHQQTIDGR